jgi:antitoxin (DNA-binding transcriptional repressor) of toxin-antitoxin stability system
MSLTTTMPITKARINLGAVVHRAMNGERTNLEKGGIPVATIIGTQDLEDMEDAIELIRLRTVHAGETGVPLEKLLKKYGV